MTALIDGDALNALVALRRPGKPDLVARIVVLFQDETPGLLQAIEEGMESGELDRVRGAAHTLKSSAAYVGARELSERSARIERAAREGNLVDCMVASDGLDELFTGTITALDDAMLKTA